MPVLVDTSVWIDFSRGVQTQATDRLKELLVGDQVATGDLIVAEVLQGFREERHFRAALDMLASLIYLDIGGREVAIQAARNFRTLRARGITIRKTIDTLIATRCIVDGLPLLFSDRDFNPFVEHLGLIPAMTMDHPPS